ncbi:MAG: STAS domain-containing protein [Actinomycetota bacterium]
MNYAAETHGDVLDIRVGGRMTHADYREFREILGHINEGKPARVVFDLHGVEFVDSSALGMLLIVRDSAVQAGREIVLKGASGQVEKLIHVGKLSRYFTVE